MSERTLTPAEASLSAILDPDHANEPDRVAALDAFRSRGLPTRRVEAWKWSDLRASLRAELAAAPVANDAAPARAAFLDASGSEILIENGHVRMTGSLVGPGFAVIANGGTIEAAGGDDAIALLNRAHARDGVTLTIDREAVVDDPIILRYRASAAGASHARSKLVLGPGASATVIELYETPAAGAFVNLYTDIDLAGGASLRRYIVEESAGSAVLAAVATVTAGAGASFEQAALSAGSNLSRHETSLDLAGEGARCAISSAFLGDARRHADFTSLVRHIAPGCETRQEHRAVLDDGARGVFQGKIKVERPAQKTDGRMTARTLLLDDRSEANAKPELEIYADDVECAHGATVGALDEDALFYMRSRGLSEREARALLIDAFLADAFAMISDETVRTEYFRSVRRGWQ